MIEKLKIKAIYDDFKRNVELTAEQIKIIDMLLQKEKIIKIAMKIGVSERTVNYEIKKLKKLFEQYYELQLFKILLLTN
jgi:propanediol utilization protein